MRPLSPLFLAAAFFAGCSAPATSHAVADASTHAKRRLTIDDLYGEKERRVDFSGKPQTGLVWLDDEHWLWSKSDAKTKKTEWLKVEAATGKTEPFAPVEKVEKALAAVPGVGAEKAASLARRETGAWKGGSPKALLVDTGGDLHVYRFESDSVVRLTSSPDEDEEEAELSPDGKHVAFVRDNNLFVADVDPVAERKITTDGGELVLNGKLDWLYQEEVYGRGTYRAFWWSPDSTRVAFLRLDETGVPVYTLVDDVESPARVETSPYPRAGDTNPTVKLGVAKLGAEKPAWVDLSKYAGGDFLVVEVGWSPKGDLAFQVQDREQTWLDLDLVHAASAEPSAASSTLFRETTKTWAAVNGPPKWLEDGSFLWFSEKTGWQHLEHHDAAGKLLATLTKGAFEVRDLRGIDEKN